MGAPGTAGLQPHGGALLTTGAGRWQQPVHPAEAATAPSIRAIISRRTCIGSFLRRTGATCLEPVAAAPAALLSDGSPHGLERLAPAREAGKVFLLRLPRLAAMSLVHGRLGLVPDQRFLQSFA
jgi:hypothetical protein